jgi:hypothetical protein
MRDTTVARVTAYPRDAVLTVEEVAAWLAVSERQVQRLPLKRIHVGERTTRYLAQHVYEWLEARAA